MKAIIILFVFISAAILVYFNNKIIHAAKSFFLSFLEKYRHVVKKSVASIDLMEIIKLEIICFLIAVLSAILLNQLLVLLFFLPLFIFFPWVYISQKQKKYMQQYYNTLVDFLESIISNLKSGMSIIKSLQLYSNRDKGPVGNEISIVLKNVELGRTLQESLLELAERIPLRENQIIINAIINGMETGGNITEILDSVLETIRKRDELGREIKALTSQGILSGLIVGLLPLLLVVVLLFIDPYFIEPLFNTTAGNVLLVTAIIMEIIGTLFIKRIVDIK